MQGESSKVTTLVHRVLVLALVVGGLGCSTSTENETTDATPECDTPGAESDQGFVFADQLPSGACSQGAATCSKMVVERCDCDPSKGSGAHTERCSCDDGQWRCVDDGPRGASTCDCSAAAD